MSHFAKIENSIVTFVTVGRQEDDGLELELCERTGDTYRQTSYNTRGGVHYDQNGEPSADQTKALRKNYAGIGYMFDEERDAFIPPKPYESWILNEDSCLWDSLVPYPSDGGMYMWDETAGDWVLVTESE
jgi:hypothetical protein